MSSEKTSKKRRFIRLFLQFLLVIAVLTSIYVFYLNQKIQTTFTGAHWAVPGKIYARPLELHVGKQISADDLAFELELANYHLVQEPKRGGQYMRQGNRFRLIKRDFHFYDGEESQKYLEIVLSNNRIAKVINVTSGDRESLVRLDPAIIGRFFPAHNEDRELVKLENVPPILVAGLIATEDRNFFEHIGIDFKAIARAFAVNMKAGRVVQGGSTITQQLIKNFYLTNTRSFIRKGNEAIMALLLEHHATKHEILEAYLNEVYLGQDGKRSIHGVGLGSQFYFGTEVKDLKLHQLALIIGLVKGPSYYDPRRFPDRAKKRRNVVLKAFAATGMASDEEVARAVLQEVDVIPKPKGVNGRYPAYVELVKRQLREDYDEKALSSEGLKIFSSFDPRVQRAAENAVRATIDDIEASRQIENLQASVVVAESGQGEVVAVVGDKAPTYDGYNRAIDAKRQIGSVVKPVVYAAAHENNSELTLASPLQDIPLDLVDPQGNPWSPRNYDQQYHGTVPMYQALAQSYNVPTVRLGLDVGYPKVVSLLQKMGVNRELPAYMSSLLGVNELSAFEVAQVYHTLSSNGFVTPLKSIREVLDKHNTPLRRYPIKVNKALGGEASFQVNYAMYLSTQFGTGKRLKQYITNPNLKFAGKTGTTDNTRDSWFAGFTGDYVAAAWVGRDDNTPTELTGAGGALPIVGRLFGQIAQKSLSFQNKSNVDWHLVDRDNGGMLTTHCNNADKIPFFDGRLPVYRSDCYGQVTEQQQSNDGWLQRLFQ